MSIATEPVVGRLVYGTFWKIPPTGTDQWNAAQLLYKALIDSDDTLEDDAELSDYIDVLCEKHGASVTYMDKTYTIYFGHTVEDISTAENKFNEISLLRIMDLDKGVLRDDVRQDVKQIIESIPYSLRESFSRPQFFIAWGRS